MKLPLQAPFCTALALWTSIVSANTEKTIFIAPEPLEVPSPRPTLEDLALHELTPARPSLSTVLPAVFPNETSPKGVESWFLLRNLREGQRYEVRICWAATQPTDFWLQTHELPTVFSTPELIQSLAAYSESRQFRPAEEDIRPSIAEISFENQNPKIPSILFLQIHAAAAYYTTNQTLMQNPPPVLVDIILDPYVLNVFPRSLVPTAGYLVLVAVASWYISKFLSGWLHGLRGEDGLQGKKDE